MKLTKEELYDKFQTMDFLEWFKLAYSNKIVTPKELAEYPEIKAKIIENSDEIFKLKKELFDKEYNDIMIEYNLK